MSESMSLPQYALVEPLCQKWNSIHRPWYSKSTDHFGIVVLASNPFRWNIVRVCDKRPTFPTPQRTDDVESNYYLIYKSDTPRWEEQQDIWIPYIGKLHEHLDGVLSHIKILSEATVVIVGRVYFLLHGHRVLMLDHRD